MINSLNIPEIRILFLIFLMMNTLQNRAHC